MSYFIVEDKGVQLFQVLLRLRKCELITWNRIILLKSATLEVCRFRVSNLPQMVLNVHIGVMRIVCGEIMTTYTVLSKNMR